MASVDLATENQIKRLYAVLHSLGHEPKDWKKGQNIGSYAKLTRGQCSDLIDVLELEEAEKKGKHQEAAKQNGEDVKNGTQQQISTQDLTLEQAHAEAELSRIAVVMKFAAREAKTIVEEELINGTSITEGTKASLIERFAVTMFIEGMRRGL